VAVAQVVLDYRRNPHLYADYPPSAVLALAENQRISMPSLGTFGHLVYISKALACGYKLRDIPAHSPKAVWRAIHKRAVGARRS
jgi:hypothetical protein